MRLLLLDRRAFFERFPAAGENSGVADLSPLEAVGELTVYEETSPLESFDRAAGADVILTAAVPISRMLLDWAPRVRQVVILGGSAELVDPLAAEDLGVSVVVVEGASAAEVIADAAEAIRNGVKSGSPGGTPA